MGQKLMSPDQALELLALTARKMPKLDSTTAQGWIDNPDALERFLRGLAAPVAAQDVTYIERFDAPQQNTEFNLSFLPYLSHYDLWDYTTETQNYCYYDKEVALSPDPIHVKLLDLGKNVASIDEARAKAEAEGYRLVSATWSLAFRRMFPRPGRLPVAFGSDRAYWMRQGLFEEQYLILDPAGPHEWRPRVIGSGQLLGTYFLWAATPITSP